MKLLQREVQLLYSLCETTSTPRSEFREIWVFDTSKCLEGGGARLINKETGLWP